MTKEKIQEIEELTKIGCWVGLYSVGCKETAKKAMIIIKELQEELRQKDKWQPIATAPKNKAVLVMYGSPFSGVFYPEVEKAYFNDDSKEWRFNLSDRKIYTNGVTHWMPLPEFNQQND